LTGEPPVEGATADEILDAVRRGAIRSPRSLNPKVSRGLEAVCLKALASKPGDRYPSALALAEEGEHWMADGPGAGRREPVALPAGRWARRNRTTVAAGAVALVAGVVGLGAVAAIEARANGRLRDAYDAINRALADSRQAQAETRVALAESESSRQQAEA